jgi:hypothetical protein
LYEMSKETNCVRHSMESKIDPMKLHPLRFK